MIGEVLAQPGLGWLALAGILAGIVRGFSGFGTALVFLPAAGQVMGPIAALTTLLAMDLVGPLPNVPRAWREADRGDLGRLGIGLAAGLPVGLAILGVVSAEAFRYAVSSISFAALVLLVGGVRYRGPLTPPIVYGAGALGGLFGGAAGVAGPPVVILYMASARAVEKVRANLLLFLVLVDLSTLALLGAAGWLAAAPFVTGLVLTLPYLVANVAGAAMFRPKRGRAYRVVAYAIIAGSALMGLPVWD